MRIPKKVLIVGIVEEITYLREKAKSPVTINFSAKKGDYLLATNQSHTALFIFKSTPKGKVEIIRDSSGKQSGFLHQIIHYEIPSLELKKTGQALTIRYRSTWWEGELMEYRHDFDNTFIFSDSYSRSHTFGLKPKKGKILTMNGITG